MDIEQAIFKLTAVPLATFDKPVPLVVNGNEVPDTTVQYITGSRVGIQVCNKGKRYCMVVVRSSNTDDVFTGKQYPYSHRGTAKYHATIMNVLVGDSADIGYVANCHLATLLILKGYASCDTLERMLLKRIIGEYQCTL